MCELNAESPFVADYDADADVLYIHLHGGNPNSYSIGNPASIDGVEWLVEAQNPDRITGVIVQDWRKLWIHNRCMPPLPMAVTWAGDVVNVPRSVLRMIPNK